MSASNHTYILLLFCTIWRVPVIFLPFRLCYQPDKNFTRRKRFYVAGNSKTYSGIHVKCPIHLPDFNETLDFSRGFHKVRNIKFYEYPSSGSRADVCGETYRRTDRHRGVEGRTVMTKGSGQAVIGVFKQFRVT